VLVNRFSTIITAVNTVRQRILEFIRSHRAATAAELSQAFRMSKANARHHLAILMEEGSLQVVDTRQMPGKGRPERVFAPSDQALGNNLDILASVLLQKREEPSASEQGEELSQWLAKHVAEQMNRGAPNSDLRSQNLTRRLNRLTQILNRFHYQSRWEAHHDAPRLILGHCPYAAIVGEHPELCQMDARLIERLLGSPVDQSEKLAKDASGLSHCVFRVGKERV
jgi:DeoR family suf operon transcriptional repressor